MKLIKIILVVFALVLVDSIISLTFNITPIIKIRKYKDNNREYYIDKGVLVNYFKCENGENNSTLKLTKYACPLVENNDNKYNIYDKYSDRIIYLSSNIEEDYIEDIKLKEYLRNNNLDSLLDKFTFLYSYDDGGTSVYKLEEKDLTLIVCNTLNQNKDIYIGDKNMKYESDMCK